VNNAMVSVLRSELIHDNGNVHLGMVQMPAMNTPQLTRMKRYLKNKSKPKELFINQKWTPGQS
jgi:hypothetical protein